MREVERSAQKKRRTRNFKRAVLMTIAGAGMIALGAVPPISLKLLSARPTAQLRYQTKTVLGRLRKQGLIEFIERDERKYARLTSMGQEIYDFMKEKMRLAATKPKKWDKRYRLVMFDISEKRKKTRDRLRKEMRAAGFLRVQDSAWVYPYDCEEFVALLKSNLHIGKDVLYAVIEEIENDTWIQEHFKIGKKK